MSGENYEENKRNQFKNNTDNNRYMNVSHVSIFIGEEDGVLSVLESTKCENGVKITPIADMAETILFIARVKKK